jgi:hypothetical protein
MRSGSLHVRAGRRDLTMVCFTSSIAQRLMRGAADLLFNILSVRKQCALL